jgi:hypothetical protein
VQQRLREMCGGWFLAALKQVLRCAQDDKFRLG